MPVETVSPECRAQAAGTVNRIVGQARLRLITDLPGQDMVYLQKRAEAQAYLTADPEPADLADFPFIAGELGITGQTPAQVAQVFANRAWLWRQAGAAFEAIRVGALGAVAAAVTRAEVEAAVTAARQLLEEMQ